MIHVLHYISGLADVKAGVETYIMNMNEYLDKTKFRFHILTRNAKEDTPLYREMLEAGIEIHNLNCPSLGPAQIQSYRKSLEAFFAAHRNEFSFLHMHGCDDPFLVTTAKKYGIRSCGVHAHSVTRENNRKLLTLMKAFTSRRNISAADYLFASCDNAGKARFGNRPFEVLRNTLKTERFAFSEKARKQKRLELGLGNSIVFCFVGRMVPIKNIPFLMDVFCKTAENIPGAKLLIVGDGELWEEITTYAKRLPCADQIIFLGNRSDVAEILGACDIYMQTSFSEGFSIAALEAQCSGIPMFISTAFPEEINLTDLVHRIDLNQGSAVWAETITEFIRSNGTELERDRSAYAGQIRKAGYDCEANTEYMCRKYYGGDRK